MGEWVSDWVGGWVNGRLSMHLSVYLFIDLSRSGERVLVISLVPGAYNKLRVYGLGSGSGV